MICLLNTALTFHWLIRFRARQAGTPLLFLDVRESRHAPLLASPPPSPPPGAPAAEPPPPRETSSSVGNVSLSAEGGPVPAWADDGGGAVAPSADNGAGVGGSVGQPIMQAPSQELVTPSQSRPDDGKSAQVGQSRESTSRRLVSRQTSSKIAPENEADETLPQKTRRQLLIERAMEITDANAKRYLHKAVEGKCSMEIFDVGRIAYFYDVLFDDGDPTTHEFRAGSNYSSQRELPAAAMYARNVRGMPKEDKILFKFEPLHQAIDREMDQRGGEWHGEQDDQELGAPTSAQIAEVAAYIAKRHFTDACESLSTLELCASLTSSRSELESHLL